MRVISPQTATKGIVRAERVRLPGAFPPGAARISRFYRGRAMDRAPASIPAGRGVRLAGAFAWPDHDHGCGGTGDE